MEVRNSNIIEGKSLFATKTYVKDEIIHVLTGKIFDKPTRETIHVGDNKHIYDEYGIYMNHSFEPNTYINDYSVIALCDINIGDELTFNYNENEIDMANPFYVNDILVKGKNIS